ncbi:DUF4230 domain-containing protein [Streptomyces sp. SBST2-5]|uniref:DUF4230 domain-containing protein n=1 Tax=Streptomyces composti TaxID=2720025 RepID=A0ABX1A4F1_9ACTN|nr:DUF4230 domain-containing protein [Streptomyces composti]NJP48733.1 DUF4230 domain-containing protein [Streptomyces composti]
MTTPIGRLSGRTAGRVKVLSAVVLLFAVLLAGIRLLGLPGPKDVFGTGSRDRGGPAPLRSVQDISRHEAASGSFQVVVGPEKDAEYLPDALRGSRTPYVGAGSVDGCVVLGKAGADAVGADEDRTAAPLRLPHARLGHPAPVPECSSAVSKQRGPFDRLGDPFPDNPDGEQAVRKLAVRHIGDAAKESGLPARAEADTTEMLRGPLRSLGFEDVRITYGD